MEDEDRPKPRIPQPSLGVASLLASESLDSYSLDELDSRVKLLQAEIARITEHREKASEHMRAAEQMFRRPK